MSELTKRTKNVEKIRQWAEERGGRPAHVARTGSKDDPGILRLMFPDAPGSETEGVEEIGWDDFAAKFKDSGLTFLYQEDDSQGHKSNFNKFIRE